MPQTPFQLPPGPERRKLMCEQRLNISPNDYTPEEWAAIQEKAQAAREVFASMESEAQS
jgi:hypothetical protein